MNSTRPTTSANGALDGVLGAAVAVALSGLAGLVFYAKCRDLWGSFALSRAGAALGQAQTKAPGAARDNALAAGVASVQSGIAATPDDPRLWDVIAELRLQQAIGGAVGGVSSTLLFASASASQHAAELAPHDGAAHARLAYVKSLQHDAAAAAAALAKSYAADLDIAPAYAQRRLQAAGRAWNAMDEALRARVLAEACTLSARSEADRTAVQRVRLTFADVGMALALDQALADAACAPASAPPSEDAKP